MARLADREVHLEAVSNHRGPLVNRKQFRMHGAAQNREIQLRDIWPDNADIHDRTFVEPEIDESGTAAILVMAFNSEEADERTISRR